MPGTIYGIPKNPLVDAGIQNIHSIPITALVKASLDRGRSGMVGKGASFWVCVHIDDGKRVVFGSLCSNYMNTFAASLRAVHGALRFNRQERP